MADPIELLEEENRGKSKNEIDEVQSVTIKVMNSEGGGDDVLDESEEYEDRFEWLQEQNKKTRKYPCEDLWATLSKQEYEGKSPDSDEKLVAIYIPEWFPEFASDSLEDEAWKKTYSSFRKKDTYTLAIIKLNDKDNHVITNLYNPNQHRWERPKGNKYGTLLAYNNCVTVITAEGEPSKVDKQPVYREEAIPDDVSKPAHRVNDEEIDWRYALREAYNRAVEDVSKLDQELHKIKEEYPELATEKMLEVYDNYLKKCEAQNINPSEEELALLLSSLREVYG